MSKNSYSKIRYFSFEEAEEIRKLHRINKLIYKEISILYNTHTNMIKNICNFYRGYSQDKDKSRFKKRPRAKPEAVQPSNYADLI